MPSVSGRFKTFHKFASASLEDIYGVRLKHALRLEANHLESGIWINQTVKGESIRMDYRSLPWIAQLSPVNDVTAGDFDGDGCLEVILAQNHFTNQVETNIWRGTAGCHLEWRGGAFEVINPATSGIYLPRDTKSILSLDSDVIAGQNNGYLLRFSR